MQMQAGGAASPAATDPAAVQQAGGADHMVMQGAAGTSDAKKTAQKICDRDTLVKIQSLIRQIRVADPVMDHLVEIIEATHEKNCYIKEGSSPRGAQAMLRMARARAFLQGRYNVSFEDVRFAAYPVLRHRIIPSFDAISEGVSPDRIIDGILQNHPVKNA
ncbi:MAG: MoxR family ATPase [Lachnospiraceae bacterium]|nr:MoxR family ATPase [Lachnospiraceae bacterium]